MVKINEKKKGKHGFGLLFGFDKEFSFRCISNALQAHLPYIFPSSDRIILRRPQGGYIASASWKLCSMSGLHTPSASPSMALSSSSPPSSSPCSGLPLALHLLDAMVPAPTGPFHEPPRYTSTARKKQGKREKDCYFIVGIKIKQLCRENPFKTSLFSRAIFNTFKAWWTDEDNNSCDSYYHFLSSKAPKMTNEFSNII